MAATTEYGLKTSCIIVKAILMSDQVSLQLVECYSHDPAKTAPSLLQMQALYICEERGMCMLIICKLWFPLMNLYVISSSLLS